MYIISHKPRNTSKSRETYRNSLAIGQGFEDCLVQELRDKGIRAYKPRQRHLQPNLLRKHQLDILVPKSTTRRLSVEVKARLSPFKWDHVFVGCTAKWDAKKHPGVVVVIDQQTLEARVAKVDLKAWKVMYANGEDAYAIPKRLLYPLDTFIAWYHRTYPESLMK